MKIFYSGKFIKMLERVPKNIQELFFRQGKILKEDWRDQRLHLKKLNAKPVTFSFRITRSYRVFFYFRKFDEITLYAIGHRERYLSQNPKKITFQKTLPR